MVLVRSGFVPQRPFELDLGLPVGHNSLHDMAEIVEIEVRALAQGGEAVGKLPSGKAVTPGQILVLTRRRDAFVTAINRALKRMGVETAGIDRIATADHIAVLDLLALADVMLMPADDLQLAACLKSPLFGFDDEDLLALAPRRRSSLWQALAKSTDARHQRRDALLSPKHRD